MSRVLVGLACNLLFLALTCLDMPPHGAGLRVGNPDTAPRESIEVRLLVMTPL